MVREEEIIKQINYLINYNYYNNEYERKFEKQKSNIL